MTQRRGDGRMGLGFCVVGAGMGLAVTWPLTGLEYVVIGFLTTVIGLGLAALYDPAVPEVTVNAR